MITKEIIVKKELSRQGWPYPTAVPTTHTPQVPPRRMDKLEYAKFMSELGIKDGDIVYSYSPITDNGKDIRDFAKHRFFIVGAIQELHYSVDYRATGEPMSLYLINFMNAENPAINGFWTSPGSYKKVDYNELNQECRQIVDSRNNRNQAN